MRWLGLFCVLLGTGAAFAQPPSPSPKSPKEIMADIAQSHINGNVPDKAHFEAFLSRDLTAYFTNKTGKKVIVKYEWLRNGPTQSGVSYPKYYLWVRVFHKGRIIETGAVRVAAIDQKQFEVTTFLSKTSMKRNSEQMYQVFPRPVGDKIKAQYLQS